MLKLVVAACVLVVVCAQPNPATPPDLPETFESTVIWLAAINSHVTIIFPPPV